MVWEQRCATIVMMTKLEERSRIKCDQYWPGRGAETYGLMHVLLVDVAELATYTIRTFHIQKVGRGDWDGFKGELPLLLSSRSI